MDLDKFFEEEQNGQEFNFDFKRYLRGIYKRKWIVLGIFLIIIIPWLLHVKSQPPEYEANTWIRFKNYDPGQLRALNESRYIELTSRTFAEKVVAQLGLTLDLAEEYKKKGLMRQDVFEEMFTSKEPVSGNYLLVFKDSLFTMYRVGEKKENRKEIQSGDIREITKKSYEVNGITFRINSDFVQSNDQVLFNIHSFRSTVRWFRSHLQINMHRGGTLMQIRMVHDNPEIVAQMVNRLAEIYVDESISFEKQEAKEQKRVIEKRLKLAEQQLRQDEDKLKEFKKTHFISLDTDVQNRVDSLSSLQTQLENVKGYKENLIDYINKLEEFENPSITPGEENSEKKYIYNQIAQNPLFRDNADMGVLRQQLSELETQREEKLDFGFTEANKDVLEIDQEISTVHSDILKIANRQIGKVEDRIQSINRKISNLRDNLRRLPSEEQKLANLSRKVEISQKLYDNLLIKSQEVQLSESVDAKEIDILDPAIPPNHPMNRGKKKKAAIGGIFALFFSVGIAIFIEFMDKSIKSPDDIKRFLNLNVIGSIPKINFNNEFEMKDSDKLKQIDSQLVTYDYSPTPVGEAYRALRTKIVFSKQTGKVKTLVVSSFAPGDGKSFTSANLAITLAQHKSNTLLVDADLRRGVLHNTFGIPKEPGFSNFLMGMSGFEEIIKETYIPNLNLVSCGSMMPNPSELLGSSQLKRFIEIANKRFDIVLFDTPPLNAATDSVVLGTQSDGVVLIVRSDETNRNVAKQKLDLFENVPANVIGVILNGTDSELAHDGYSYYHY